MKDPTHNHIAEKIEFDPPESMNELLFNAIMEIAKNKNAEFIKSCEQKEKDIYSTINNLRGEVRELQRHINRLEEKLRIREEHSHKTALKLDK